MSFKSEPQRVCRELDGPLWLSHRPQPGNLPDSSQCLCVTSTPHEWDDWPILSRGPASYTSGQSESVLNSPSFLQELDDVCQDASAVVRESLCEGAKKITEMCGNMATRWQKTLGVVQTIDADKVCWCCVWSSYYQPCCRTSPPSSTASPSLTLSPSSSTTLYLHHQKMLWR